MKTWKNIFPGIVEKKNVQMAIWQASKGKRKRDDVQGVLKNEDYHTRYTIDMLVNREFEPCYNTACVINEGTNRKIREIHKPNFKYDQIVHHATMQQLIPVFMHGMYEYVCGSIPERGSHMGKRYIEKSIVNDHKNTKYCCKMDIHHFFASVDHDVLIDLLDKKIKDADTMWLLKTIIEGCDEGLPLGNYTSPWFGNFMLQGLDHYIKETLHVKYYVRYMDDMVIFGRNKKELHKCREAIEKYLDEQLHLQMKANWQVFRFDYVDKKTGEHRGRPLDFMGFVFYSDRTIIRKSIMLRATRKARRLSKKDKITWHDASSMVSYMGWISNTDTHGMYLKHIKPYVDIKSLKIKVSKHQRSVNKDGKKMEKYRRLSNERATGS